ncbi:transglutaminase domain-containing protein [candidate division WWE3 bacterium]|nr:transglutaminase domain-containing protein [candidate division WWE3 bacterium]
MIGEFNYYIEQSKYSDPGEFGHLYKELPSDIESLTNIVNLLIVHRDALQTQYSLTLPKNRKLEADTRYVSKILQTLSSLDNSSLTATRLPKNRFIGTCRDYALLLCSILRYKNIPARIRCGFALYFYDKYKVDHWVCEYWDNSTSTWKLVDANLGELQKKYYNIRLTSDNISREDFYVAGKAWQLCTSKKDDPDLYGVPGINKFGSWFVSSNVYRDLLALNKIELLPWDYMSFFDRKYFKTEDYAPEELEKLNKIAQVTANEDSSLLEFQSLFDDNKLLSECDKVISYTIEGPKEVSLS